VLYVCVKQREFVWRRGVWSAPKATCRSTCIKGIVILLNYLKNHILLKIVWCCFWLSTNKHWLSSFHLQGHMFFDIHKLLLLDAGVGIMVCVLVSDFVSLPTLRSSITWVSWTTHYPMPLERVLCLMFQRIPTMSILF
jgi:hypothetical protein